MIRVHLISSDSLSNENKLGHAPPNETAHNRPWVHADTHLHWPPIVHSNRSLQHGLGELKDSMRMRRTWLWTPCSCLRKLQCPVRKWRHVWQSLWINKMTHTITSSNTQNTLIYCNHQTWIVVHACKPLLISFDQAAIHHIAAHKQTGSTRMIKQRCNAQHTIQ